MVELVSAHADANRGELVFQNLNLQGVILHQLTSLLRVTGG